MLRISIIVLFVWTSSLPLHAQLYAPEIKVQATTNNQTEVEGDLRVNGTLQLGYGNKLGSIDYDGVATLFRTDIHNYDNAEVRFEAGHGTSSLVKMNIGVENGNNKGFYVRRIDGNSNPYYFNVNTDGKVGIGYRDSGHGLQVNGSIASGQTVLTSDKRLKEKIRDYAGGLELVKSIKIKKFRYKKPMKTKTSENDEIEKLDPMYEHDQIGLLAQELQLVAPELVGSLTDDNEQEILTINHSSLTYVLIDAVKEQQVVIENLQKEVDSLKKLVK